MSRPDPHTPDDHRSATDQSAPKANAQDLSDDLGDEDLKHDADTGSDVRTPEPDADRQGEAGNAYVGREMKEGMKANPRIEDADRVQKDS